MGARLVPQLRTALAAIAASVAVVAVLGVLVHDDTRGNRFDNAMLRIIDDVVPGRLQAWGLDLTDPWLVIVLLACIALGAAARLRWDIVVLTAVAPVASALLTEDVLKPIVHRSNGIVTHGLGLSEALAYPSGHETGLAALVCVAGVIVLASALSAARTLLCITVLAIALVAGAVGLVGHFYHYTTDTIGAFGVALAVTLAAAMAIDAVRAWLTTRRRAPARAPR